MSSELKLKQKIERMQQRLVFWVPPHEMEVSFFRELLEAALEQRVVTIMYEASSRRKRMIQPLGIYTMNGLWYCQAYCFLAGDYRVFRVDRVKDFSLEADQSMRLNTADKHIQTWIMRMDESDTLDLEVNLMPEGVRRCRSDLWLTRWIDLREDGSGTICTKMSTSYVPWAVFPRLWHGGKREASTSGARTNTKQAQRANQTVRTLEEGYSRLKSQTRKEFISDLKWN